MSKAKEQIKKMVRDIISETISNRKLLKEDYKYEKEKDIEVEVGGKMYLAKGTFTCDVEQSQGGFEYDHPFGGGGGYQNETETEVTNQEFVIEELFPYIDNGTGELTVGTAITDPKILAGMQAHINKTIDFRPDEDNAIQAAHDAAQ
jgi:hypothetical protein